jgi:hypothetical protein
MREACIFHLDILQGVDMDNVIQDAVERSIRGLVATLEEPTKGNSRRLGRRPVVLKINVEKVVVNLALPELRDAA